MSIEDLEINNDDLVAFPNPVRDLEQGKPTLRIDKVNQVMNHYNKNVRALSYLSIGKLPPPLSISIVTL